MGGFIGVISSVGALFPVPGNRFFAILLSFSILIFIIAYSIMYSVTGNNPDLFIKMGFYGSVLKAIFAISVFLFLCSGCALMFRAVFRWNGSNIIKNAREFGRIPAHIESVSKIEFSNGCIIISSAFFSLVFLIFVIEVT